VDLFVRRARRFFLMTTRWDNSWRTSIHAGDRTEHASHGFQYSLELTTPLLGTISTAHCIYDCFQPRARVSCVVGLSDYRLIPSSLPLCAHSRFTADLFLSRRRLRRRCDMPLYRIIARLINKYEGMPWMASFRTKMVQCSCGHGG